jgi:arylsulfatase A-like enzyme
MERRSFLKAAASAGFILPLTAAASRPNVIIVLTDDQGYGDLSSHGNPVLKTPNLDRLRGESVRFTDFHVMPMCTPTRSQLMTGRDCLINGAMNVSSGRTPLRTDVPTMAETFAASGYRTAIFGKWHLGDTYPYRPEDRGFQEAVWFPSSHIGSTPDAWNNDYFNDTYHHNGKRQQFEGYCTDVFFGEAMNWMRERARAKQPFFTYLATNAPHGPLFVPEKWKQPYAGQAANVASFFGMIANIDDNMNKLEKMLADEGIRDNTILIFMTDNGATGGFTVHNAGMRGKKIDLWDGGHRVPFFIRWPEGKLGTGKDIDEMTVVQDVLPTLIDLCGLKKLPRSTFDGVSLAGLLHGAPQLPDRMKVIQFSRMDKPRPTKGDAAVLWKKWRLVSDKELYDLSKDPAQKENVIGQNPRIAAQMRTHYEDWWKRVEPGLDTFQPLHIGSDRENPVLASPTEWADVFLDQGIQIRAGVHRNGSWLVMVEQDGEYEFTLRRWAREVDVPMRAGLPPHQGECGSYKEGVALPIFKAELKVGERKASLPVEVEDRQAIFKFPLRKGRTTMQSWFYDADGKEICGAYYVYVERKKG